MFIWEWGYRLSALVGAPKKIKGAIMIKPYNRGAGEGKAFPLARSAGLTPHSGVASELGS